MTTLTNNDFKIHCMRCNKQVDKLQVMPDQKKHGLIFTVYCHGDKEETFISMKDYCGGVLTGGQAFKLKEVVE